MSQIIKPGTGGGGGGGVETIAGDVGSITGANVTIFANQASLNSGSTVSFNNSGTTSTFNVTDSNDNTIIGLDSGINAPLSTGNTGLGNEVLTSMTTASFNVFIGNTSGREITEGDGNVGLGVGALSSLQEGGENVALGGNALLQLNDPLANANCAVGSHALEDLLTGQNNIALGQDAGGAYASSESNNIAIGNMGVLGDNGTIRLGTLLTQSSNFQAGIAGVTVSNAVPVVIDSVTGQLGQGSPVYFQAYRTSNQSVAGGSTADTIIFDTAIANVGGAYNTGTGVFTAPSTGFYSFCSTVYYADLNVPSGLTQVILGYTGSVQSLRLIQQGIGAAVGGTVIILTASFALPMTAGDTIQMQPFADGTGNYTIFGTAASSSAFNTSSTFAGYRIA